MNSAGRRTGLWGTRFGFYLAAIGSDGVLSVSEKPRVITEYTAAGNDFTLLKAKADAVSIPYTAFAAAFGSDGSIFGKGKP